jgi:hypothetical protein
MASESTRGPAGQQQRTGEGTVGEAASAVREKVGDVASSVASTAEEAWDRTRRAATSVAETAGTAWDDLTGLMSRYPFATLFVGIGVGICVSRLIEGRASDRIRRFGSDMYDRARDYASDVASRFESRTGRPLT